MMLVIALLRSRNTHMLATNLFVKRFINAQVWRTLPSPYSLKRYWMMASLSSSSLSTPTYSNRVEGRVGVSTFHSCRNNKPHWMQAAGWSWTQNR
jgi:hypothetical protein